MNVNPIAAENSGSYLVADPVTLTQPVGGHVADVVTLPGPWRCAFWIDLPLVLQSKSNFRRFSGGSNQWERFEAFESGLRTIFTALRPDCWVVGDPAVAVRKRPAVISVIAARSKVDAANFSKSALDALEGVLYVSDAQVRASCAVGERGSSEQWLTMAFAQLDASSNTREVLQASAELLTAIGSVDPHFPESL